VGVGILTRPTITTFPSFLIGWNFTGGRESPASCTPSVISHGLPDGSYPHPSGATYCHFSVMQVLVLLSSVQAFQRPLCSPRIQNTFSTTFHHLLPPQTTPALSFTFASIQVPLPYIARSSQIYLCFSLSTARLLMRTTQFRYLSISSP
jgi:hypothetical protein